MIIDCNIGADDSLVLKLVLNSDETEVTVIIIVCGNFPVEMGDIQKSFTSDRVNIFLICIDVNQLFIQKYVNALDTHGEDGLGESVIGRIPGYNTYERAVSFLTRILQG